MKEQCMCGFSFATIPSALSVGGRRQRFLQQKQRSVNSENRRVPATGGKQSSFDEDQAQDSRQGPL